MNEDRLLLDMIAVTIDVESKEERRAIHKRIKVYKHGKVISRYTPNCCKGCYHNTYQFKVSPREGKPFTLKVSYNPIDGHLEKGKRRFLRVEFNPSAVGGGRMWILRKILCRLLGEGVVVRLATESVVTRVDLAIDFKGVTEQLYLYETNARTSSIFQGADSTTHYVGGRRSRVKFRYYDKDSEIRARGGVSDERGWYRLEAELKDLRCAPAELGGVLKNPFTRLRFYDAAFIEDNFSKNQRLEERFRGLVRERGMNAAFRAGPLWRNGAERYLAWLEDRGYRRRLFDAAAVWQGLGRALEVLDGLWEESTVRTTGITNYAHDRYLVGCRASDSDPRPPSFVEVKNKSCLSGWHRLALWVQIPCMSDVPETPLDFQLFPNETACARYLERIG